MRKDLPCADYCGEHMWRGPDSLPEGVATCLPCRRGRPGYGPREVVRGTLADRQCLGCDATYSPHRHDQRYCSTACNSRCKARAGGKRTCEVCEEQYKPTYVEQRTCGRICGAVIKRPRPVAVATFSVVKWRSCAICSTPYTTKGCKRCACTRVTKRTADWRGERPCAVCGSVIELHCFNMKRRYCDTCLVSQRRREKDKRRALKRNAYVADVSPTKIYRRDGYRCKLCSKRLNMKVAVPHPMAPTIDHIIPLAQGGTHEPANAQAAHFLCNSIKGDRGGNEQLLLIG